MTTDTTGRFVVLEHNMPGYVWVLDSQSPRGLDRSRVAVRTELVAEHIARKVAKTEIAWKTWPPFPGRGGRHAEQRECRKTILTSKVERFVAKLMETDSLVADSIVTRPV